MKNYDNNQSRYNYQEDTKKKKKSRNLLWLLLLLCFFFVAIVVVIILGFTFSWYSFTQKMEGDFDFKNGIVITFKNVKDIQDEQKSFSLIKTNGDKLSEQEVAWSSKYEISNPTLQSASGSVDYFLRAKLDYTFTRYNIYDETDSSKLKEFNLEELAQSLTAEGIVCTKDNVLDKIFTKYLQLNDNWLKGNDGWYYYVNNLSNWTNSTNTPNYLDIENSKITTSTPAIKMFKETDNKLTVEVVPGETYDTEIFLIKSCKITITLNACETTEDAFNSWIG